jgi:hypothetical protein
MSERDSLQSLWTSQTEEPFVMSLAELSARAKLLHTRVRFRNIIEYAAGVIVVVAFTGVAIVASGTLVRVGSALIALGAVFVCWRLHVLARAAKLREFETAESCADFHRGELVRQRDALRGIWRWYLGPLVPGLLVYWIGVGFALSVDPPLIGRIGVAANRYRHLSRRLHRHRQSKCLGCQEFGRRDRCAGQIARSLAFRNLNRREVCKV